MSLLSRSDFAPVPASGAPTTDLPRRHPAAGRTMTGADMIVQLFADEGVEVIFGYSGGAILPTYDAVFRYNASHKGADGTEPMPLIVPANEQAAGFMAAGYSRASGRVGVALVTSGPGATNTVTPVRDCMADSIPIVVVCGQVPTGAVGTDAFQEAPISAIMGACAKHVFLVTNPAKLEATMRSAFLIARSGRPGPVVVDVPKDVQNWTGPFKGDGVLDLPGYFGRLKALEASRLTDAECAAFFERLNASAKPLLYVGGGGDPRRGLPGAAGLCRNLRHSGRDDADGHRRAGYDGRKKPAHARHARGGLRQLRG